MKNMILHMNSSEVHIPDIEQRLANWTIPKQSFSTIYQIGTFDFLQGYSIKANELTVSINKDYENIRLLSQRVSPNIGRNISLCV